MRRQRSRTGRVGVDVQDLSGGTVGVQVCNRGGGGATFVQEDERDVVRLGVLCQRLSLNSWTSSSHVLWDSVAKAFERNEIGRVLKGDKYRLPLYRNTGGVGDLGRVDLAEQSRVDGCVTVLACDNDKGIVVETL